MQENNIDTLPIDLEKTVALNTHAFSSSETVFSWIALLMGYLFCRVHPAGENTLGGFLFVIIMYTVSWIIMKMNGVKLNAHALAVAVSALALNFTLLISSNEFICSLSYMYSAVSYCYFVYLCCGNSIKSGFNNYLLMDYFKALFLLPFYSFDMLFRAAFSGKAAKSGKVFLKALLGIVVAIIPTAIVFLLLSYDDSFSKLLSEIFDFSIKDVFSHIGSLILGIPVGMYIFGLYVSAIDRRCDKAITLESCESAAKKISIVPCVTSVIAVLPILFIYVIFFISQWQYYISGFTGVLPEDFSYAKYAREGFFQLCAVSVINLIIVTVLSLFMRRDTGLPKTIYKIIVLIFSVFTLILISTAVAKMVMYINCYGLTQKRVYSSWFMIVLALIFILLAVKQFALKLNSVAISVAVFVVMLAVLSLGNTDRIIAKYNVDRYIDNTLKTVDVSAMRELGDSAIPELVRLEKHLSKENENRLLKDKDGYALYFNVKSELDMRTDEMKEEKFNVFAFNLPSYIAENALESREKA